MCVKHWSKGRFYEARPGELLHYMYEHYDGPRGHWVDIGAHFGNHAVFARKVLGFEFVTCFEPSQGNRLWLYSNTDEDEGVEAIPFGCSDKKKTAYLKDIDAPNHSGSKYIAKQGEQVHLFPLDHEEFKVANVIKIDAEGHEKHVIRGAMQTIARCRPWLLVETDDPGGIHAMLPNYEAPHRTANASPTYVYRPCK